MIPILLAILPIFQQGVAPAQAKPKKPFSGPFQFANPVDDRKLEGEMAKIASASEHVRDRYTRAVEKDVDESGRPLSQTAFYIKLRDQLIELLDRKGGHLRWLIQNNKSATLRRACYFGSLFVPNVQDAMHLLRYIPYEPVKSVRQTAIAQALPFLRMQLGLRSAPGSKAAFALSFDMIPWVDLTRSPHASDRVLAFRVLTVLANARPRMGVEALGKMRKWTPSLLNSKHDGIATAIRAFIQTVEPEARMPKERGDAAIAYWRRVMDKLFPAINIDGGIGVLYLGEELDAVVAKAVPLLRHAKLGKAVSLSLPGKFGMQHRAGVKLAALPDPLNKLGLATGDTITSINGTPVPSCADLLDAIQQILDAKGRVFTVEWLDAKKVARARRYEIRSRDDG